MKTKKEAIIIVTNIVLCTFIIAFFLLDAWSEHNLDMLEKALQSALLASVTGVAGYVTISIEEQNFSFYKVIYLIGLACATALGCVSIVTDRFADKQLGYICLGAAFLALGKIALSLKTKK